VLVTLPLLVLLAGVGFAPEGDAPPSPRRVAGPARAAGAAAFGLVVGFLWQFYVDTALPFPRWVVAVIPAAALALGALLATRRAASPSPALPRVSAYAALATAAVALVSVGTLLVGAGAVATQTAASPELRVMAYNIRSAADVDGQIRPDVVAEVVRSLQPDLIMLSEVGRGWPIHAGTDVAAWLERELGYTAVFMGSADDQFGNLVLSRYPMTARSTGYLPDVGGQRRSYVAVDVDIAGTPVLVVGSHLEDRSIEQMNAVLDVVGDEQPAILLGDINTWPDLPEAATLTSTGLVDVVDATGDVCRTTSAQPTRPCDRPDWILVTDDLTIDEVVIGTTSASDHLPLVAALTLP
jgi:endonuclease/exonuclease/phosphatase family metal-dependent hydrolase